MVRLNYHYFMVTENLQLPSMQDRGDSSYGLKIIEFCISLRILGHADSDTRKTQNDMDLHT